MVLPSGAMIVEGRWDVSWHALLVRDWGDWTFRGSEGGQGALLRVNGTKRKGPELFVLTFPRRSKPPDGFHPEVGARLFSMVGLGIYWQLTGVYRIPLNMKLSQSHGGMR